MKNYKKIHARMNESSEKNEMIYALYNDFRNV